MCFRSNPSGGSSAADTTAKIHDSDSAGRDRTRFPSREEFVRLSPSARQLIREYGDQTPQHYVADDHFYSNQHRGEVGLWSNVPESQGREGNHAVIHHRYQIEREVRNMEMLSSHLPVTDGKKQYEE